MLTFCMELPLTRRQYHFLTYSLLPATPRSHRNPKVAQDGSLPFGGVKRSRTLAEDPYAETELQRRKMRTQEGDKAK